MTSLATSPASAQNCSVPSGTITCSGTFATTETTNTNGGTNPSTDSVQLFNNGTAINATISTGADITGYGLAFAETGSTQASILVTNDGTIESDKTNNTQLATFFGVPAADAVAPALTLVGNGDSITYNDTSSSVINATSGLGIVALQSTGNGQIELNVSGTVNASFGTLEAVGVITTDTVSADTTIDLTGSIQGITTKGLESLDGITANSSSGDITITANNIAANDFALEGINASITDTTSGGKISITATGTINAATDVIEAVNTDTGGITITADSTATLSANLNTTGTGLAEGQGFAEYANDSGAGGSIVITNDSGSTIKAATGVDAQITNSVSAGAVTVDQSGTITATVTGIVAATDGTGTITVDNTGSVTGGSGAAQGNVIYSSPTVAANVGIFANQAGSSGGIVIEGNGSVSGNDAILAVIDSGTNTSNILVNLAGSTPSSPSGNVTVTGTEGWGIAAETFGTGLVTVENTGTIAPGTSATDFVGILAISGGGSVVVDNVGAITVNATTAPCTDCISGIFAETSGTGTVTVNGTSTVTSTGDAIDAVTSGTGNVSVTGTGALVGSSGGAGNGTGDQGTGVGIFASSQGGTVTVTPGSTVSGATGIVAVSCDATAAPCGGNVSVTVDSAVTGTLGDAIQAGSVDGNINVTADATVSGKGDGVDAETIGLGSITVTGSGNISGGDNGISAIETGTGPASGNGILISGSGDVSATTGAGITAQIKNAANVSSIDITQSGTVTVAAGGGDGIQAITVGSGNVSVTGVGNVTAGTGAAAIGIDAEAAGGNVLVTPAGTVSGGNGIKATTIGNGTVTVTTVVGATGNVTGSDGFGIETSAADGNTVVTNDAAAVSGTTWSVVSTSTGLGLLTIAGTGDFAGGSSGGIGAFATGIGPAAGVNQITITGSGNVSATTGVGIEADISDAANVANILVNITGTVTVGATGGDGVEAITAGDGNVTVTGVAAVQAGTGASATGVLGQSDGGNISITPSATVSGGNGIEGVTTGAGTVTVTTASGAPGNVTGLDGFGVETSAENGATVITNSAAQISGTTWAITALSTGTGTITIQGTGNDVGGTLGGVSAVASGAGPGAGNNAILVTGSGNTSATTGTGIFADITDAANAGNILVNATGTVTVGAGGKDGIDAITAGVGNVTVTGVGNVTAGTGTTTIGILADGAGGDILVTPAGTVTAGGTGIVAETIGAGTVTVTTATGAAGDVTGTAGDGIDTVAVDGATVVTNNTDPVTGGVNGDFSTSSGAGPITVTGPGTYAGGSGYGIEATETGIGPGAGQAGITVNGTGNTSSVTGTGILAAITDSSNASNILVDRSGTTSVGTGGDDGIEATTTGTGNVTVSGVGNVTAGTGTATIGILADATGGNVLVTPAGTVTAGGTGISASATASGTVTVTTASAAAGNVTGTAGDGIDTFAVNGNTIVTNNAATVTGGVNGVDSLSSGTGIITITGAGTYAGGKGDGIEARATGTGPAAGVNGILIEGSGNTTTNGGVGILAAITSSSNKSNITIDRTGTVTVGTSGDDGIAASTAGTGNVTVTGVGNVTAGTGTSTIGVLATSTGGNILVTPAGTVTAGGTGISAATTLAGTITVTTATGIAGNVTGTAGDGIDTSAVDGNTVITNSGSAVSGGVNGVDATSSGLGVVTVTGSGTYAGGSGFGIEASETGAGPGAGNDGVAISGSANVSSVTGTGISAFITDSSNQSNIDITDTGTVTVGAGGGDGIDATTVGTGNIIISGVGNVVSGTAATTSGIFAVDAGGNITIAPTGTVTGGGVGINAHDGAGGNITIDIISNVTGTASDGIFTDAVNGLTTVDIASGIVSGNGSGRAGIDGNASGTGNLDVSIAAGATVTGGKTAAGVVLSQTGTGSNVLINNGTVTGEGTQANPVIGVSTAAGTSTVTNNGLIVSTDAVANNAPADVAIESAVTTGNIAITNAGTLIGQIALSNGTNSLDNQTGGVWDLRDNPTTGLVAASFGAGGANTLINAGTINAGNLLAVASSTFTGIQTIDNTGTINAGLFGPGDVTTFEASPPSTGVQTVNNAGTINVHGLLNFEGDSTFNNAGGTINMSTAGHATTDVTALNVTVGTGTNSNTYTPGPAYNFAGGAGSVLAVDTDVGVVNSSGSNVPSDRLLISGTATGTTGIVVNDTSGTTGAFNPLGITLVGVNGASSNAFFLQGVTGNTDDLLQPSRGPMGAIKKGFFFYPLLQSTHAQAAGDGLSGPNSSEYRLYGLPDIEAFELPLALTGAENIWYDTVLAWSEHLEDSRRAWEDGYEDVVNGHDPGVWLKITGAWTDRTDTHDLGALVPAASVLPAIDTSFGQSTYSIQFGGDMTERRVFGEHDAFILSGSLGYINSALDFKNTPNSFDYSGFTVGGSANYVDGHFFADAVLKADLLHVNLNFNTLEPFGYAGTGDQTTTWGVMADAGLHFNLEHTRGVPVLENLYVEPVATIAYTQTSMDNITALSTTADFNNGETFRGAIGGTVGAPLADRRDEAVNVSITAKYWNEFTNDTQAILVTEGPVLPLEDTRQKSFAEVLGTFDFANFGNGWSAFLNGGARFNSQFTTEEVKVGARYSW